MNIYSNTIKVVNIWVMQKLDSIEASPSFLRYPFFFPQFHALLEFAVHRALARLINFPTISGLSQKIVNLLRGKWHL